MIELPQSFKNKMESMLGGEYPAFLNCYQKPYYRGIRLNTLKCGERTLKASLPFSLEPTPFSPVSYYIPQDAQKVGSLPMHHAGAFYSQEPSAASAVTALNPVPGDRVLDLCAAPGGKSTQIAALLQGSGLLWSNEIVRSRANVLLSNLERTGVRNAVVSSCHPETLCSGLAGYFDKVLVDAPCSGEGMFRRDEQALQDWSREHVEACAVRQLAILRSAAHALKENGVLVYSTCTFSKEENEEVVASFLAGHEDFVLEDCGAAFGRPGFLPQTRRIYPMDGGEGQFMARMRRLSPSSCFVRPGKIPEGSETALALSFYRSVFRTDPEPGTRIRQVRGGFFLVPDDFPEADGLGVLRAGLMLGTLRVGRVEPAHALFMAAKPEELRHALSFASDSAEIAAFLRGEELQIAGPAGGYCAVLADGVSVGFGKCSDGRIKNHYPKGLRNIS